MPNFISDWTSAIRNLPDTGTDSGLDAPTREIDFEATVAEKFAAGQGVLIFSLDTPDDVILAAVKRRLAGGKPFKVIPA